MTPAEAQEAYDSAMGAMRRGFAAGVLFTVGVQIATVAMVALYRKLRSKP